MGHRLSKITTRTGDLGMTGLASGERIAKSHPRMVAIGEVDELNSQIGYALTFTLPATVQAILTQTQHYLFELGVELCSPGEVRILPGMIVQLETVSTTLNATVPPLKEFILPGGAPAAAVLHIVRAVCRRAERAVVTLQALDSDINPLALVFLNRLSDLCFILTRHVNMLENIKEPAWEPLNRDQIVSMS